MHWRTPLLVFALAASGFARDRIAYIEFFGYQDIDTDAVRKALPFREGDQITKDRKHQARAAVKRVTGHDATDVSGVCCVGDGDSVLFIGLSGASSQAFTFDSAPNGNVMPPPELTALYGKMNRAEGAAVQEGIYEEDGP